MSTTDSRTVPTVETFDTSTLAPVMPSAPSSRIAALLRELDAPLLRSMRVGYIRVATRQALRTAAFIREELEERGEVLT